jgi:iron complex transport system ATP-binding protein
MTIEVRELSFSYPKGVNIFADISFTLSKGEVLTILGANGAGKTTLLNCIANQEKPDSGRIVINGLPISRMSKNDFAKVVAYVPQFHQPIFPYSVLSFVTMGRAPYLRIYESPLKRDTDIAMQMIDLLNIRHLAEKSYLEISGGERQLVMIAQALAQEPDFLIFDEPTSHLDFGNQIRMLRLIEQLSQGGYGILLTSHYPDHSLMFNHTVAIMHEHSFIALAIASEVITKENMEEIYGLQVEIETLPKISRKICLPV